MPGEPFLRRLKIRNFKSIGKCDLELGRMTLLVGRNGAGKSNLLDALRFIGDGLQTSLDHAIKSRGGIDAVRRRSQGHPHNFALWLELNLPEWRVARYGFEIGAQSRGGFFVKSEHLEVVAGDDTVEAAFAVEAGVVVDATPVSIPLPPATSDRLLLVTASGLPPFRPVYDALLSMGFYNLNPEQMKEFQVPDAGELLRRDGSNIASVVARLAEDRPELKVRIEDYLRAIVPDVVSFERIAFAHRETLEFRQRVQGSKDPWRFNAASMSDGTLRTLGILVAAMQLVGRAKPVRLVGIEEPETALHPAAAAALMESLREAAEQSQIVLTTHSPDLLDEFDPETDYLLAVNFNQGITEIGPVDPASRDSIKNHLYTAGELLRMDQLQPDRSALERQQELVFELSEAGA